MHRAEYGQLRHVLEARLDGLTRLTASARYVFMANIWGKCPCGGGEPEPLRIYLLPLVKALVTEGYVVAYKRTEASNKATSAAGQGC